MARWRVAAVEPVYYRALLVLLFFSLVLGYGLHIGAGDPANAALRKYDVADCTRATFRVVLDVGHTADAPGALSARGAPEYAFNLHLARQIEAKLVEAGFASTVVLITAGKARHSLFQRVERANAMRADLFLSIHHDSVPQFLKQEWEYEGQKISFSDRFKGHSIFVSYDNDERKASVAFAKLLGAQLKARGLSYTPHYTKPLMGKWRRQLVDAETGVYRYDELIVLRLTDMAAVLLEAGSIVNREEELLVASPDHQSLIAAGVVNAVENFCALRSAKLKTARR